MKQLGTGGWSQGVQALPESGGRVHRVVSRIGLRRLLGDGVDGVLVDLPLSASAGGGRFDPPLTLLCLAVLERVWTLSALAGVVAGAAI